MTFPRILSLHSRLRHSTRGLLTIAAVAVALHCAVHCSAQGAPAPNPAPDVLILSNGDTLHGKFVSAVAGKVTFHTDSLGDLSLGWDKIKELHTTQKFAVLDKTVKLRGKKTDAQIPVGTLDVDHAAVIVHGDTVAPAPIRWQMRNM